jgi:hypothetical protein
VVFTIPIHDKEGDRERKNPASLSHGARLGNAREEWMDRGRGLDGERKQQWKSSVWFWRGKRAAEKQVNGG